MIENNPILKQIHEWIRFINVNYLSLLKLYKKRQSLNYAAKA